MTRRVQQFRPASGKVKQGQLTNMMNSFLDNSVKNGKLVEKEYSKTIELAACRFCEYKNTEHCPSSINVN
jgi:hypothetical protein